MRNGGIAAGSTKEPPNRTCRHQTKSCAAASPGGCCRPPSSAAAARSPAGGGCATGNALASSSSSTTSCSTSSAAAAASTGPAPASTPSACAPNGGELTGPNPTDRGKLGTNYHLLVDRGGIPLAVRLSAANTHGSMLLEAVVDAVPPIKGPRGRPGRPRKRPAKLHGDKGTTSHAAGRR